VPWVCSPGAAAPPEPPPTTTTHSSPATPRGGRGFSAELMFVEDNTPAHRLLRMLGRDKGLAPGDQAHMAARSIASSDVEPAPLRMVFGSQALESNLATPPTRRSGLGATDSMTIWCWLSLSRPGMPSAVPPGQLLPRLCWLVTESGRTTRSPDADRGTASAAGTLFAL
jgi:hypothetical protein